MQKIVNASVEKKNLFFAMKLTTLLLLFCYQISHTSNISYFRQNSHGEEGMGKGAYI